MEGKENLETKRFIIDSTDDIDFIEYSVTCKNAESANAIMEILKGKSVATSKHILNRILKSLDYNSIVQ